MFRPTRFYHAFADDNCCVHTMRSASVSAPANGSGPYVHRMEDAETGRTHEHYFDTLREFVIWHYTQHDWVVPDGYPAEDEVTVRYSEATAAIDAATAAANRAGRRCSPRLNRHVVYADDVIVIE